MAEHYLKLAECLVDDLLGQADLLKVQVGDL